MFRGSGCVYEGRFLQRTELGVGSLGTGVTGSCELPGLDVGTELASFVSTIGAFNSGHFSSLSYKIFCHFIQKIDDHYEANSFVKLN